MKKYEYAELKEKLEHGNWCWFVGNIKINNEYEFLTRLEALNRVGEDGWRVVAHTVDSNSDDRFILMKEYDKQDSSLAHSLPQDEIE